MSIGSAGTLTGSNGTATSTPSGNAGTTKSAAPSSTRWMPPKVARDRHSSILGDVRPKLLRSPCGSLDDRDRSANYGCTARVQDANAQPPVRAQNQDGRLLGCEREPVRVPRGTRASKNSDRRPHAGDLQFPSLVALSARSDPRDESVSAAPPNPGSRQLRPGRATRVLPIESPPKARASCHLGRGSEASAPARRRLAVSALRRRLSARYERRSRRSRSATEVSPPLRR